MVLTSDEFSGKQLDQLEERMRKVFNEGIDALVIPQLDEIKDTQSIHSDELGQIKGMVGGQQKLVDHHDREIERLLKQEKLEPLALEE